MTSLDPRLDPEIAALLAFLDSTGSPPMHAGTAEQARASFRALTVDLRDPSVLPEVEEVTDTTVPGGDGDRPARVYRPGPGALPTVVLFHGGGWVIGDLDTHDLMARTIATICEAVVVSVDYRLAPEHPFPAAVDDALAAARWAAAHLADLGGDERLGLAGDSAGGNLAAVAAQVLRDEGVPVAGQLLVYPATDLVGETASRVENAEGYFLDRDTMLWFAAQYVGHLPPDRLADPRLSPLRGDLTGLAPAVVAVAQFDPLRDEGTAYAEALRAAGVPVRLASYDGLIHGFVDMGRFCRAADDAVNRTCRLFHDLLHP
ncbi:alpha/beta hydrolase [Nocardioides pantholopis]|uniref:alpha/beta hydrolase n=1 Tax=Nocardioides pantholopis TaxID=2483798 RepID=UPI001F4956D9|nr:alpha/beta hydrolase [Nocardioides pantholopis]